MIVETLSEWNQINVACGCCPMPECVTPLLKCESKSGGSGCPEAPDPPAEPADDETITYGCFIPFSPPSGDDLTELTVYKMHTNKYQTNAIEGKASYFSSEYASGGSGPVRDLSTVVNYGGNTIEKDWFQYDYSPYAIIFSTATNPTISVEPVGSTWVDADDVETCEMTSTIRTLRIGIEESINGDPEAIPTNTSLIDGTPPTVGTSSYAWDLTRADEKSSDTLSLPLDKADLIALAVDDEPADFPSPPTDISCVALTAVSWPKKGDYLWPDCATSAVRAATAISATRTSVRYRWQIPETHLGSYFKITWDVLTEPTGFDDTIDDPDYEPPAEEPEGGFPPVPQVPKPGRPLATLEEDLTWVWEGPGTPIPAAVTVDDEVTNQAAIDAATATWLSSWYDLTPPAVPGQKRVVNIRYECYHSTKLGTRPQTTGEGYTLPAP